MLLGLIIARVAKKSYGQFMHEEILSPAGTKSTFVCEGWLWPTETVSLMSLVSPRMTIVEQDESLLVIPAADRSVAHFSGTEPFRGPLPCKAATTQARRLHHN